MSNFSKKIKNVLFPPQESRVLSDEITEKQKKRLGMHFFPSQKYVKLLLFSFSYFHFWNFCAIGGSRNEAAYA